ncbi:4Fe-4S dicluster domain-containing protein [Pseudoflavonifractor phocaeensis]|uniref:4Fe-4S dicluster domain-containing protein n=1 Tax=Pseudoflavonifractor phocaeensis TaxID=1870988 RepID=UPI001956D1E7|nr:4Fe-4S dicluster domain-containing protein [Pseudoflavonifractor phocaeensis]MBM6871808.1 4Fe-4S dicluster domain-containing protein [Pseudoflavonifractor phocaeensis]MBM6938298.1 4Fe-4S dicluster domain-containing protein [Pseudoflavonifractor phocaeensis]
MRGVYTSITEIRRNIFTEIARMAYGDGDYAKEIEELPFKILPGEQAQYRDSIFLERAIVGERLRLAMGLPVRTAAESAPISKGIEECTKPETYYEPPLINIIKFACHACPEKRVVSTEACQGCLGHPCTVVCPKDAIHIVNGRSVIDQDKCIKCGRCVSACPYNAIIKQERPCMAACGVNAIGSDEYGRASIDYNKCVSCGMCLVNCPFGAIADKSQIFQLIQAMKHGEHVYAAVAPAFVDQFGPKVTPEKLRAAMKALGFTDVLEVAVGADLCAAEEARDFVEEVPEKLPFMGTSCCPAWSVMAKQQFPEYAHCISMALTPMVLTGRLIKMKHPNAKIAFIGPCAAKKLEAMRKSIRSDVDFVLTFEEMMGLFNAKNIDIENIEEEEFLSESSTDGRNFAFSGGVAQAVVNCIKQTHPDMEVKVASAQGLEECRKMMMMAKAGKYNGYLLEGMACPGGCVAGAGTMVAPEKTAVSVKRYAAKAEKRFCTETDYLKDLERLEE